MRRIHVISSAMLVIGGMVVGGCKTSEPPSSPAPTPLQPTTMAVPETNGSHGSGPTTLPVPPAAQTAVVIPAATPPAAASLTHVLAVDQPFFLNEPGATPKPVGTLKAGSRVLMIIPGSTYTQVETDKGITCYTATEGLNPLGK